VGWNSPISRGIKDKEQVHGIHGAAVLVYEGLKYREESTDENDAHYEVI
jgi:hypothetical protein